MARPFGVLSIFTMLSFLPGCGPKSEQIPEIIESGKIDERKSAPMKLHIIVGTVRQTQTGHKIANNIKRIIDKRPEISAEIVDIASYNLPFYADPVAPAKRTTPITDPILAKWSEKIKQAQGFIIISPVYNDGYPGALKNSLDSLYEEWNNKPVAFVGYSGGPSGGASMIAQLRQVARGLKMTPVAAEIKIPQSWKALDEQGNLMNADAIEKEVNIIIDQILEAQKSVQAK